jgi:hypothetical protein
MRKRFFRILYRYQLGFVFISMMNFAMLVVIAAKSLGFRALPALAVAIPVGFFGVWLLGYFLDSHGRSQETNEQIFIERSPLAKEHYRKTDEMYEAFKNTLPR